MMMSGGQRFLRRFLVILNGFVAEWSHPFSAALFTFLFFAMAAQVKQGLFATTDNSYYSYLADAFLHGQLNLRLLPPDLTDLIVYNRLYYLYWPPLPAVVFLPFVAVFGVGVSDVFLAVMIGTLDVGLVAGILDAANHRGLIQESAGRRGVMVVFFALGTMFTPLPFGNVWATGQIIGLACVGLTYWAALRFHGWKAFLLAGVGMACAFATRNSLVLVGLWPAWYLLREHKDRRCYRRGLLTVLAFAPILVSIGLIGWYNFARFGSLWEIGYRYHQMNDFFRTLYEQYGAFNLHYLPTNLYYQFVFYPFPPRGDSIMGGSLFLLSPLFFAALWSLWQDRQQFSTWVLVVTLLVGYIPIGLLMGTGALQFGPRYLLDLIIPMMLLTSNGIRRWPCWLIAPLAGISIIHYLLGLFVFFR